MGQDYLAGRGRGDIFTWTRTADRAIAGAAADVGGDFNRAEGDLPSVSLIDANESMPGDQAFTFVGVVNFTSGFFSGAGQIGYFTDGLDTYILLNTTVNPGADGIDYEDATIRLVGVHTPDVSWFAL